MPETKTLLTKAAVLEQMAEHPAVKALLAWNAEALTNAKFDRGELTLTIQREQIRQACEAVKAAGYNASADGDGGGLVSRFAEISSHLPHSFPLL